MTLPTCQGVLAEILTLHMFSRMFNYVLTHGLNHQLVQNDCNRFIEISVFFNHQIDMIIHMIATLEYQCWRYVHGMGQYQPTNG